eukprot:762947-Hanusia_phi.AAC.7
MSGARVTRRAGNSSVGEETSSASSRPAPQGCGAEERLTFECGCRMEDLRRGGWGGDKDGKRRRKASGVRGEVVEVQMHFSLLNFTI